MTTSAGRVKVLSVVGPGRGGTTLLGNILGEIPGFFCAGELRWLWERGLQQGGRCGCGRRIAECDVWAEALASGAGQLGGTRAAPADPDTVVAWQHELLPRAVRLRVLRSVGQPVRGWTTLDAYTDTVASLLRGVTAVTGAHVVVDTSKRPIDAAVIATIPFVEPYVVHIVRDPRGVAYSWGKVRRTPDGELQMGSRTPLSSAARWTENNLRAEYLRRRMPPERWLFLRYEDFAHDPAAAVQRIVALLEEPVATLPVRGRTVSLSGNHTVLGNPNRFQLGDVTIAEDDAWRRRMPTRDRLTVTAATLPLFVRYGYHRRASRVPERLTVE